MDGDNQKRRYTVIEIESMRQSINRMTTPRGSYHPAERAAEIEDRLRTYMQNSTDPAELTAAAQKAMKQDQERFLQEQAIQTAMCPQPPSV